MSSYPISLSNIFSGRANPVSIIDNNNGATRTGAIGPLRRIVDLCSKSKLWFHISVCYGGAVGLVPELDQLVDWMSRGDSSNFDLHKRLFMASTTGVFMTRHAEK